MSSETLNLSREKKREFRAGKYPPQITPDMIREMNCIIDCPSGTPNYKEFRVTEGMLFTRVPMNMSPPIEYCDRLVKINGAPVSTQKQMMEALYKLAKSKKPHYLVLTIRRVISVERIDNRFLPSNAAIKKPAGDNDKVKPNYGYLYYKIVLIYFPRSKLGINVKSFADVVYVESTDNSWGSTTRRFLYLGDAILKIDNTEIQDVHAAQAAIRSGFQKNGIVTLIVERAVEQSANNYVRNVLSFNKVIDPHIPKDVIMICAEQLAHYEKNGFEEPKPIFKGHVKSYESAGRVVVTNKVDYKNIRAEHFNPTSLVKVPDFSDLRNRNE